MRRSDTTTRILDTAQELVQTRGYNAFSYRDLAARIGIRTASIHYHFPAKSDLGRALIQRYRASINQTFNALDRELAGREASAEKLRRYAALLERVLSDGVRMCLGGMLATDFATLPEEIQGEVALFVQENERWIARVLADGRDAGALHFSGDPALAAAALFAALEGAMFTSRSRGDVKHYRDVSRWLVEDFVGRPTSK